MIEIIVLIFLCRQIGETATRKGLPPGRWKFYLVMTWILMELVGFSLGVMLFGNDNIYGLFLFAVVCAFGGYLLVKYLLDKMPDQMDDEINRLGE